MGKKMDMSELIQQHNWRFGFQTSQGEVILKRISYLDHQRITCETCESDPEYEVAIEKLAEFNEVARAQEAHIAAWEKQGKIGPRPVDFPEQYAGERARVRGIVAKYSHLSYAPCFVKPVLESKEALDTFLDNLMDEERNMVVGTLITLTSGIGDVDKNIAIISLSAKYGIRLAKDLFVGNMTRQQAELLMIVENAEQKETADMLRGLEPK